jgi:hypothetical protein
MQRRAEAEQDPVEDVHRKRECGGMVRDALPEVERERARAGVSNAPSRRGELAERLHEQVLERAPRELARLDDLAGLKAVCGDVEHETVSIADVEDRVEGSAPRDRAVPLELERELANALHAPGCVEGVAHLSGQELDIDRLVV